MFNSLEKKRVLIIGDSLALPREKPEKVRHEETWPELLKQTGKYDIIQLSLGGGTIGDLYDQISYYKQFDPDFVIIQSGIVDCSPRALTQLELKIFLSNKLLRILLSKTLPLNFLRNHRKITYVTKKNFTDYYENIITQFKNSRHILISILPISSGYEKKIKGIGNNQDKFNNIIKSLSVKYKSLYLNTDLMPIEGIMTDFHHLNSIGHYWIYSAIVNNIDTLIPD
jgi:hypothetical protein